MGPIRLTFLGPLKKKGGVSAEKRLNSFIKSAGNFLLTRGILSRVRGHLGFGYPQKGFFFRSHIGGILNVSRRFFSPLKNVFSEARRLSSLFQKAGRATTHILLSQRGGVEKV